MNRSILNLISGMMTLGFLTTACSVKSEFDEMREATKKIEKNAGGLGHDMRELEASNTRTAALKMMNEAQGDADRFAGAAKFFSAMEMQKWKGDSHDDAELRLIFFERAVRVFFAATKDWLNYGRPINFTDDVFYFLNDAANSSNFRKAGAMAAEMDLIHAEYEKRMREMNADAISLYDLVVWGLLSEKAVDAGEPAEAYVIQVLKWKPYAIYYLQLRHNFLIGKLMGKITPYSDNFLQKLLMSTSLTRWMTSKTVDLDALSGVQLQEAKELMSLAEKTKADLLRIGLEPAYNSMILNAWQAIEFSSKDPKRLESFRKAKELSLMGYLKK